MQKSAFLAGEGDAWFDRNPKDIDAAKDPVICALGRLDIAPRTILEVGCAGAMRLDHLRQATGAECYGIDPSEKAISHARHRFPHLNLRVGSADDLAFPAGSFDVVILGFCLYCCDPADHFRIVAEVDRSLKARSLAVIYDFLPRRAYRNPNHHREGIFSYKMQWAGLFLSHPSYSLIARDARGEDDDRTSVDILRKDAASAFPDRQS